MSSAIGVLSAVSAPWLVPLLFGADFGPAVPLLWLLIPGQVLYNTAWVISARFLGAGRPGVAARAIGVAAVTNVVALGPAVSVFGAAGAAMLTSVCQGMYLAGVWWGLRRDGQGDDDVVDVRAHSSTVVAASASSG
ncbi:MAG: polysaccharide biosynthesis C-terminal domain-containing protein [Acidimicrobiales bacterium]|nr:polysaccharide biosynthesis C-terminal domain-containing protein [Acidimicrobiales bacterium]